MTLDADEIEGDFYTFAARRAEILHCAAPWGFSSDAAIIQRLLRERELGEGKACAPACDVTQEDRQRAALEADENDSLSILKGDLDEHPLVQAFARHRIAAIAAAEARADARIVAWLRTHSGSFKASTVADAIEAGEHLAKLESGQ